MESLEFSPDKRARDGLQSRCRPCCRKAKAAAFKADPEGQRAKSRARYKRNPAPRLAANARSREKNRESVLAGKRRWYEKARELPEYKARIKRNAEANKGAKREYDRHYRLNNAEKLSAFKRAWRADNAGLMKSVRLNYKARRRAQEADGVGARELADWVEAQPKVCFYCGDGCQDAFHLDHFLPLAKGGAHVLFNLRIACPTCNVRKNAMLPDLWMDLIAGKARHIVTAESVQRP